MAGLKRLALVVALLGPTKAAFAAFFSFGDTELYPRAEKPLEGHSVDSEALLDESVSGHFSFWPWHTEGEAQQPPPVTPYRIPTLSGDNLDFREKPPALVKAPHIDADAVYQYVLACYPEPSKWNLDVNLRGQLASTPDSILSSAGTNSTELGSSYVAIVASMPLYSSSELNREKERESQRRQDVAGTVANFIGAIASRNHAIRELALYRSLEARAALRVQQGITDATEQVKYLEKVAASHETLIRQEAQIMEMRLKLMGMCDPNNALRINGWLKQVSAVPHRELVP